MSEPLRDQFACAATTDVKRRWGRIRTGESRLDLPELDAAIPDLIVVVLKHDVTFALIGEARNRAILALRQQRIHARCLEVVANDERAVEPMLAVVSLDQNHRTIPLA